MINGAAVTPTDLEAMRRLTPAADR
jgi:hypothetical protein